MKLNNELLVIDLETTAGLDLCACGKIAEIGAHGLRNKEVYSESFCVDCYNKKKYGSEKG